MSILNSRQVYTEWAIQKFFLTEEPQKPLGVLNNDIKFEVRIAFFCN